MSQSATNGTSKPLVIPSLSGLKKVPSADKNTNVKSSNSQVPYPNAVTPKIPQQPVVRPLAWLYEKNKQVVPNKNVSLVTSANENGNWYSCDGIADILSIYTTDEDDSTTTKRYLVTDDKEFNRITADLKQKYDHEVKMYHQAKSSTKLSGDQKWINDVIKSGTLSDKVAGLALKVQESPIHELQTLDALLELCAHRDQRHATFALEAVKDLFIHNLLPDRRLQVLKSCPFKHPKMTLAHALIFYFEDQLMTKTVQLVSALENGVKSTVDHFKRLCMGIASELLMSKPEQEARLLMMLVNKLGDPSSKIVTKSVE